MLALYGHPFSSYTWKAQIALHALGHDYDFRIVDADHLRNVAVVQAASPHGKFPVLADGDNLIFESTAIIEYLDTHYPGPDRLIPDHPDAAIAARMLDRVFDNYVMNTMQAVVEEYLGNPNGPNMARIAGVRDRLRRSYAWLETWLQGYPASDRITLVECAAAPALFYADWVEQIGEDCPRLRHWRSHLNALPAVSRCIEAARPFRANFPPGAPDRD